MDPEGQASCSHLLSVNNQGQDAFHTKQPINKQGATASGMEEGSQWQRKQKVTARGKHTAAWPEWWMVSVCLFWVAPSSPSSAYPLGLAGLLKEKRIVLFSLSLPLPAFQPHLSLKSADFPIALDLKCYNCTIQQYNHFLNSCIKPLSHLCCNNPDSLGQKAKESRIFAKSGCHYRPWLNRKKMLTKSG